MSHDERTPTSRHRRSGVGPTMLGVATLSAIAVIAWGVGGSAPAPVAKLEPVAPDFVAVTRGTLTETTRVTSTVSRGQIVSLEVPAAVSSGTGGASGPGAGSGSASSSLQAAFAALLTGRSSTATPASGAPASTAPRASVAPTTAAPTTTVPATTPPTAAPSAATGETPTTTAVDGTTTTTGPAAPAASAAPTTTAASAPASTPTTSAVPGSAQRSGRSSYTGAAATPAEGAGNGAAVPAGVANGSGAGGSTSVRVVTGVASNGAVLKGGDTAFAIDGRPTVVVPGAVPAWRAIDGTTSDGVDVHQVETFLQSKGFTDGGAMKVDDHVTSGTVAAIKAWQTSMEIDATGRIELGEIVFLTGDVTVVAVNAKVGQVVTPGDTMLDVRSGTPFVDVSTDSSWAKVGDPVKVSTGRSTLTGTVATFASGIARVGLAADAVVTDGAAATVTLSRAKVSGQLLVPASAILRDDTAGPTVMVKRGGSTRVARVAVVASANGIAAVRPIDGDLDTSDRVSQY